VGHAGVMKFRAGMDALAIETGKNRRGRRAVKTLIVEADSNVHAVSDSVNWTTFGKPLTMDGQAKIVKRKGQLAEGSI
jgi:hypothetical protein